MSPSRPEARQQSPGGTRSVRAPVRRWRLFWVLAIVLVGVVGFLAWKRVGMLDLPSVSGSMTFADSGLEDLNRDQNIDAYLRASEPTTALEALELSADERAAVEQVRRGLDHVRNGEPDLGLQEMQGGMRRAPGNLVLGNAYRMSVFQMQRAFLRQASVASQLTPPFPQHLRGEPIAFLEALHQESGAREVNLQLALAWVDQMLMFPALEIKAPASVESVRILSEILQDSPGYVPALFARGLNHLHRPARLVWPESESTRPDAAAQDIGRCIAIGRRFDAGTPRLKALLAVALGDAYIKAGRYGVARSWWQIAQNLSRDEVIQEMVRRRYGWGDAEALDRLEEDLDRSRLHLDVPMTDLAFVWS